MPRTVVRSRLGFVLALLVGVFAGCGAGGGATASDAGGAVAFADVPRRAPDGSAPDAGPDASLRPDVPAGTVDGGAGGDVRSDAAPSDAGAEVFDAAAPPAAVGVVAVEGDSGDLRLSFRLAPPDGGRRDVSVAWSGVCAAGRSWPATTSGARSGLGAATHALTWHSWDDAAGCAGEATLTVTTDRGEVGVSAPIALANVGDRSGFVAFPQLRQGVNDDEVERWEQALTVLLPHPAVDFVATRRGDTCEVHAARGAVTSGTGARTTRSRRPTPTGSAPSATGPRRCRRARRCTLPSTARSASGARRGTACTRPP